MNENDNNHKSNKINLDGQSIKLLIDKKIADAKVMIAEKRLNFVLAIGAAFLTIFGIIIPMYLSQQSEERVDKAIEKMEAKFNELAGKQLTKPEIAFSIDGQNLLNNVVRFDSDVIMTKTIVIKNVGDGTAEYISMRLYLTSEDDQLVQIWPVGNFRFGDDNENPRLFFDDFRFGGVNDKPEFKWFYRYDRKTFILPAKDSFSTEFFLVNHHLIKHDTKATAIIKIFYGEPTPIEVPFTIEINKITDNNSVH